MKKSIFVMLFQFWNVIVHQCRSNWLVRWRSLIINAISIRKLEVIHGVHMLFSHLKKKKKSGHLGIWKYFQKKQFNVLSFDLLHPHFFLQLLPHGKQFWRLFSTHSSQKQLFQLRAEVSQKQCVCTCVDLLRDQTPPYASFINFRFFIYSGRN